MKRMYPLNHSASIRLAVQAGIGLASRAMLLAAFIGALLALEGCAGSYGGGHKRMSNTDLTLISFGSIQGEVAPCG